MSRYTHIARRRSVYEVPCCTRRKRIQIRWAVARDFIQTPLHKICITNTPMVFLKTRQPPCTRLLRGFTLLYAFACIPILRARLILGRPGLQLRTDFRFHLKRFPHTFGGKCVVLPASDRYKYCIIINTWSLKTVASAAMVMRWADESLTVLTL